MRGWREDKDWGGLLLVYREDEKKQGLFKFTPWIERGWREDKDYSGLLLVHREDGERTRISQVYSLYIERMEKRQGLFKCTPWIQRRWRKYKDYLGFHWKESV